MSRKSDTPIGEEVPSGNSTAGARIRKWSRTIHRDLSFFFAGLICIYAISGICLNHKRDFNSNYSLKRYELFLEGDFPCASSAVGKEQILSFMDQLPDKETYTRYSTVGESGVKIFFKGGSSLDVDLSDGSARYEKLRKRPVLGAFSRLHYNPTRLWTWFSDIFAVCLLLIVLTGLVMLKGTKGLWGRGGIELLAGIIVLLLFILL